MTTIAVTFPDGVRQVPACISTKERTSFGGSHALPLATWEPLPMDGYVFREAVGGKWYAHAVPQ